MNEKTYYSLRLLGTNFFHKKGEVLKTTNKVLNIGETADCEIRYESGTYEPELYASIVENDNGDGWRLIQRSEHVKARIAGSGGFGYVHRLKDGDVISFDDQGMELLFHIHHDSNYGMTGIVIEQRNNRWVILAVAAALIMAVIGGAIMLEHDRSDDIRLEELDNYLSSVYIIRVDSVQWIEVDNSDTVLVQPTKVLDNGGTVGTAFLTTDKKLVTARHCIEYWIGEEIKLTEKVAKMSDDDIRKWAILSEKFMQERENKDTTQQLRVFFSVCGTQLPDEPVFRFCSTDANVHINRYRDGILQLADFNEDYYWRSVRPYFSDQEMELGDIVYIDVDQKGEIELADSTTIAMLKQSSKIAILGHPNIGSGKKTTYAKGSITESRSDTLHNISPDLLFDANITHGFSGGPVFVRSDKGIVAAGVVSKIDTDNGIYKKAVPVTEIGNMVKKEKEEYYDR